MKLKNLLVKPVLGIVLSINFLPVNAKSFKPTLLILEQRKALRNSELVALFLSGNLRGCNMIRLKDYALHMVGKPYIWGGQSAITGFDCSGLVVELLKSCGMISSGSDFTSKGLYDLFSEIGTFTDNPKFGTLVFYGASVEKITHVGMVIDDGRSIIEAGGGGRSVRTLKDAKAKEAFVRIRPINYRPDFVSFVDPDYMFAIY